LFAVGVALAALGALFGTTELLSGFGYGIYESRRIAGVLAGFGVPAVFSGIVTVLPATRRVRVAAAGGATLAACGVLWFWMAYPADWAGYGRDLTLPVTALYLLGTTVTFACLFVGVARFKTRNAPGGTVSLDVVMTGVAIIVPLVVTIYLISLALDFVVDALGPLVWFLEWLGLIQAIESVELVAFLIELGIYRYVVDFLTEAILQDGPVIDMEDDTGLSDDSARVLRRFRKTADWQNEFGVDAIDTYAISWCEEPSHVLEVLFLADQVGIVDLPGYCGLDIVPLLESEYALSGARRIMGTLFENEVYEMALEARDGVQEIMLGYSDSNKENGFLAANWSLYNNQKRLADITSDFDVEMRLFHGRGGSISRGGGPMNDAMLALPNETVTGQIKFTEQGEAIAEKYANHDIAERNLEQMLNAQVRARHNAMHEPVEEIPEAWREAMETAAPAARQEYQDLLETDGFVDYFEQATPITVIENLNMGSRPASRSEDRSVDDLRAIPWVFSWTQARCIIPGWYSIATGLNAYLEDGGDIETLQEMYEEWPFFQTKLDNASLALARTDFDIAEEYADLADDDLRERIYPRIKEEYEETVDLVLEITDRDGLLSRDWLEENLERRNPYVDPLNLLQVRLLAQSHLTETEKRTLRLTVQGIAAGMKNTG
jgi:phosphoenolpyruvate carboxylase